MKNGAITLEKTIKTYEGWTGDLSNYLQVGDVVDGAMYDYFINVLPPRTFRSYLVQMGEPFSVSHEGKSTYSTLKLTGEGWTYAGHCHAGCSIHQESLY